MKKITLLVIMIVTAFTLNAQSLVKYHGEVNAGYSVGIGTFATNRVNIHTIQGVDISKYFSTGVGIGLDYLREGWTCIAAVFEYEGIFTRYWNG